MTTPSSTHEIAPASAAALRDAADQASALLRTLANPDRLMLLCELVAGERSVSELAEATGLQQPSLSQQLGVLRNEGLVETRREGKFIYYSLASPEAARVLQLLYELYCAPRRTRRNASSSR